MKISLHRIHSNKPMYLAGSTLKHYDVWEFKIMDGYEPKISVYLSDLQMSNLITRSKDVECTPNYLDGKIQEPVAPNDWTADIKKDVESLVDEVLSKTERELKFIVDELKNTKIKKSLLTAISESVSSYIPAQQRRLTYLAEHILNQISKIVEEKNVQD